MKNIGFALLLLSGALSATAREKIITLPGQATPVKMLAGKKQTLSVTSDKVWAIEKGKTRELLSSAHAIKDAALQDDGILWLATSSGVEKYDLNKGAKLEQTYFPGERISAVSVDAFNRTWIATTFKGVYMQQADSFVNKVNIPNASALACTPDSNIWVGTNVGLYRVSGKDFKATRYAEEGYSGYELPDNLVERLFEDEQSNVWVVMPDHISFKSNAAYQGEIPSFAYVGDKQNELETIVPVAGNSYLFATQKGIFFLPSGSLKEEHHHGNSEIFSEANAQAYFIDSKKIKTPAALEGKAIRFVGKAAGSIFFFTEQGGWELKEKDFIKQLRNKG